MIFTAFILTFIGIQLPNQDEAVEGVHFVRELSGPIRPTTCPTRRLRPTDGDGIAPR
jgi:hypothetical protein